MSDNLTYVFLAMFVVLGPTWLVFHYSAKVFGSRRLNAQDAATLDNFAQAMARMETRIAMLERILDAEVPGWRAKADPVLTP